MSVRFGTLILFTLLLFSCNPYPADVEGTLQSAGNNRPELEKVIDHYRTLGDKQKLEAAYFLIGNMKDKHSMYYGYNERMYELFYSQRDKDRLKLRKETDSLKKISPQQPLVVYDKDVITADYLIKNIELAFNVWQEPWSKHFNFDEFCEYILPYRIRNEPLSDWRQSLYSAYYWVKDSIKNTANTEEIALYVNDAVAVSFETDDNDILDIPLVPITLLDKVKAGVCEQRYLYTVAVFRAMGIPVMFEHTTQLSRKYQEHSWIAYLTSAHQLRAIDGGHKRDFPFVGNRDGFRRAFPDSIIIPLHFGFGANVFRYTYAVDKKSLVHTVDDPTDIPIRFKFACFKKVTDQYQFRKQDLQTQAEPDWKFKNKIAYLAVFTFSQELRVIDWTPVKGNKIEFKSVGSGLTYLVCGYENNKLIPFSDPILLNDSTSVCLQPDLQKEETVTLTRKFKPSMEYTNFSNAMIGCVFQGSNDSQFKNATDLFVIDEAPQYLEEKIVHIPEKFRYVRYYSPENDIRIAEIVFSGKEKSDMKHRLNGKTIYFINSDTVISDCVPKHALDGNIRTNFNAPAGSWVGLDLGKPQQITQVSFLPRNNFNVIEPDNTYELFYYAKGWHSLGIKIAKNQYLVYDHVPRNALLLLSNHTQGKEERVFTYEHGKQIFQ